MKICQHCQKKIQDEAKLCRYCRKPQKLHGQSLLADLRTKSRLSPEGGLGKSMKVFMAANSAIVLSIILLTEVIDPRHGMLAGFFVLLLGCSIPFVMLLLSKTLAKWEYSIKIINPVTPANDQEKFLLELVAVLAERAGLPQVPEVGIYQSCEPNAFATGVSKSDAMIAFSSALVEKLSQDELAAVAAHETAHITNGDMLTMTLLEGLINAIVIAISFAIQQTDWYQDKRKESKFLAAIIRFAIVNVLLLAGELVLLWFSRHREFEADELAARLVSSEAMSSALQRLEEDESMGVTTEAGTPTAAMMIIAPPAWTDIFSTHPATERRIRHLEQIFPLDAQ